MPGNFRLRIFGVIQGIGMYDTADAGVKNICERGHYYQRCPPGTTILPSTYMDISMIL